MDRKKAVRNGKGVMEGDHADLGTVRKLGKSDTGRNAGLDEGTALSSSFFAIFSV